jgi:hypothetical protein
MPLAFALMLCAGLASKRAFGGVEGLAIWIKRLRQRQQEMWPWHATIQV